VRTTIRNQSGAAVVEDKAGRDGLFLLRAVPAAGDSLNIEAWYDSLAVWRTTGTETQRPDTDGLLGGRYRGRLAPAGGYRSERVPFVPDEVLEITDLAPVMDDFLPRLPPAPLEEGRSYRDPRGWRIERKADQYIRGAPVERYDWTVSTAADSVPAGPDSTTSVEMVQRLEEQGNLLWSPERGPLLWNRRLVINARVPATGRVKRNVYSRVEQEIRVVRIFEGRCNDPGVTPSRQ
jgi:hypothetical protein